MFFFVKILAIWSKFFGFFMDFGNILDKNGVAKIKKRPDSGCSKPSARKLILPNCQKCQKHHFDRETFLIDKKLVSAK